jgi:hypothetical protein
VVVNAKLCARVWRSASARQNRKLRSAVHCASRGGHPQLSFYADCPYITARSDAVERLQLWLRQRSWLGRLLLGGFTSRLPTRGTRLRSRMASVVRWQLTRMHAAVFISAMHASMIDRGHNGMVRITAANDWCERPEMPPSKRCAKCAGMFPNRSMQQSRTRKQLAFFSPQRAGVRLAIRLTKHRISDEIALATVAQCMSRRLHEPEVPKYPSTLHHIFAKQRRKKRPDAIIELQWSALRCI